MLEHDYNIFSKDQAVLISTVCQNLESHNTVEKTTTSINELKDLITTLNVSHKETFIQNRQQLDPGTIIGSGKLIEIAEYIKENKISLIIFDLELTAGQIKKIKNITKTKVVDRCHVILEIFARNARTKESKIQIEISRLQYLLPRLAGYWTHFSRQKGGVGIRGGEGEQQIELDRRIIRRRIAQLKKELDEVKNSRIQQGKKRRKNVLSAALVGYTNVGKSSLLNQLSQGEVLEKDMLFATLDSTYRLLSPNTKPPVVLIDTVGFLNNLPNTLIDGFKTTLDSAKEADLLLVVCDLSSPDYKNQLEVTSRVLELLSIEKKESIIIFNKIDLVEDPFLVKILKRKHPNGYFVSTKNKNEILSLRKEIIDQMLSKLSHFDLFIPYEEGQIHSRVMEQTNIIRTSNHEKGIFYRIRSPKFIFDRLGVSKFILSPGHNY